MGLVVNIIASVDDSVRNVGARYFEATADAFGPVLVICATLLVMLVGINMALGIWRMSAADAWQIVTRILLVMLFATSWRNFGVFYDALSDGSAKMALSFFTGSAPSGAEAMDDFAGQMSDVVDGAAKSVSSIMRGLVAGLLYIILGVLMAAYVLIVVFSKIMIAFLLGVAPMAMIMTIFNKTKNLFEAWLSSFIGYLLYPIAAAAVIGAIVSVANEQFKPQGDVEDLSMILGFLCVAFVGIFALMQIPQAAANITGTFNLAGIAPQALCTVGRPFAAAAGAVGARAGAAASGFATGQTPSAAARTRERTWAERGAAFRQKLNGIEIMRPK
ncbi:type IV secretion system protein [Paracoccus albus]|uniref:type IV secretion system protein n=1 Tax=Paracoccus albus TaxID=3017784 RepID=UPI0022F11B72|nr:type IV secretion system protein [Paracoccus albus]WBU62214.1 type IV secretion system protein [Paracoccus albus]